MKKYAASFFAIVAIAIAFWLSLYIKIYDLTEDTRFFGPLLMFIACCYGYIRVRRSMDKEKRLELEQRVHMLETKLDGIGSPRIH